MKKYFGKGNLVVLFLAVILLISLSACTKSWKHDSVLVYTGTSETLVIAGETIKQAYRDKLISVDQYAKIRGVYNKAVKVNRAVGDVLKIAIEAEDAVLKKASFAEYQKLLNEFIPLLMDLSRLAAEMGVKINIGGG